RPSPGSTAPGRAVGWGVASGSTDAGAADASPAAGAATAAAGSRTAWSLSSSTSAYGPEPTGCDPNGSSGSAVTGVSASRWAGAIGWVARSMNPPIGSSRSNRTVRGSTTLALIPVHDPAPGPW